MSATDTTVTYPFLPCPTCQEESVTVTQLNHDGHTYYALDNWCDCEIDEQETISDYRDLNTFEEES